MGTEGRCAGARMRRVETGLPAVHGGNRGDRGVLDSDWLNSEHRDENGCAGRRDRGRDDSLFSGEGGRRGRGRRSPRWRRARNQFRECRPHRAGALVHMGVAARAQDPAQVAVYGRPGAAAQTEGRLADVGVVLAVPAELHG
ncbi:protein of unknown function [Paraburkholderia kururiensis]